MKIQLTVTVEVSHTEGKFVSKDEIADALLEDVQGADPGDVYVDESVYVVDAWEAEVA